MLLSVPRKNLGAVLSIFEREEVEATEIGRFTEEKVLAVDYKGQRVAEIDVDFLFEPPSVERRAKSAVRKLDEPSFKEPKGLESIILKLLSAPNVASKETVVRTYDHEVKGNTTIKPLQGKFAGPSDAAVIKPLSDSWRGVVVSCGMNPNYGKIDPYWMAASSIDEAVRNNTAVGGRRIALLDNFVWGNPEKPGRLGSLVKACQACYDIAKAYKTPFISGKDSLYNESPLGPVTPTLLITAVGMIPDVRKAVSMDLKQPGDPVYLVGETKPELGGSEYYRLSGALGKSVPRVDVKAGPKNVASIVKAASSGFVKACHDVSEGGLAIAAAEMAFTGNLGLDLWLNCVSRPESLIRDDFILFSESNSRFLVEVEQKREKDFEAIMRGNSYALIGRAKAPRDFSVHGVKNKNCAEIELMRLRAAWKGTLGADKYEA
jgi:phosphoribosylformylglycinamidine synthase